MRLRSNELKVGATVYIVCQAISVDKLHDHCFVLTPLLDLHWPLQFLRTGCTLRANAAPSVIT